VALLVTIGALGANGALADEPVVSAKVDTSAPVAVPPRPGDDSPVEAGAAADAIRRAPLQDPAASRAAAWIPDALAPTVWAGLFLMGALGLARRRRRRR
jgi:hypothetical protein